MMDARLNEATIGSVAQSIRELGEMLTVADQHPDYRTRLNEIERLEGRLRKQMVVLMRLISAEYRGSAAA